VKQRVKRLMSWRNYFRQRAATVRTADAAASAKYVPGRVGEASTTAVGRASLIARYCLACGD